MNSAEISTFQQRVKTIEPKEAAEYLDYLAEHNIPAANDDGVQVINARCAYDTQFFAQSYLAESFDDPMTHQHDEAWRLIDDETIPYLVLCGWRGFGKTSIYVAKKVKDLVFRQRSFLLLVGKSHDYAATITDNIKTELLGNTRIRHVFGSFRPVRFEGLESMFSRKSYYVADPVTGEPFAFVTCKGANQQVRGLNVRIAGRLRRPDDIGIDDLEDDEEVLNGELRAKVKNWFRGALLPCVPRARPNSRTGRWAPTGPSPWRVTYQDTLKHEACTMADLLDDTSWVSVVYPQSELRKTDNGSDYFSLVPEIISHSQVRAEVKQAIGSGTLEVYAREKMCVPIPPGEGCWTTEMFRYYNEHDMKLNDAPGVERFIIVDPAKTSTQKSAYTAILGVAADLSTGLIYLRRLINERLKASDIYQRVFEMAVALKTRVIAPEITGLGDWLKHSFRNSAMKMGLNLNFLWLEGRQLPPGDFGAGKEAAKRARASVIVPYYERREVFHERSLKDGALERQQLTFPRCRWWDALDCAGYIPKVLALMGRYFTSQVKDDDKTALRFLEDGQDARWDRAIQSGSWCHV